MATANARKPAPPKNNLKAPAKNKAGPKVAAKAAPKETKPKEVKPYETGSIVIFKGFVVEQVEGQAAQPEQPSLVEPDNEMAVVGQRTEDERVYVACCRVEDYHRFIADPEAEDGPEAMEFSPAEIKRTNKTVEEPFSLVAVGDYASLSESIADPLERGRKLYDDASKSFFYLGATFAELYEQKADDGITRIFATYGREDNAAAPDNAEALDSEGRYANTKDGFALFLEENFPGLGGYRKAVELIGIYKTFSVLPNASEHVVELSKAGWWKAGMIRNYVTDENAGELIAKAQENSVPQLKAVLKEEYVTEDGKSTGGKTVNRVVIKKNTFKFELYEDRATGVNFIWQAAKKQLNIQDDNALFEYIMTSWAAAELGPEAADKASAAVKKETDRLIKNKVKLPDNHPAAQAAAAQAEETAPAPETKAPPAPRRVMPRKPAAVQASA